MQMVQNLRKQNFKNNFTQTDLTGNLFKKSIILDNDFVESSMSGIRFIDTDCNGYFNVSSVYGIRGTCKENFVGKKQKRKSS